MSAGTTSIRYTVYNKQSTSWAQAGIITSDSYVYDFPSVRVYRSWLRPCGRTSPVYW